MRSSNIAAKLIIDVLPSRFEGSLFLTSKERFEVIRVCFKVKNMMDWDFDFDEFQSVIMQCHLSVEALWILHFSQVFPLETYLSNVQPETNTLKEVQQRICDFCLANSKQDTGLIFSQTGMLAFLFNKAFDVADQKIKQICLKVLNLFLVGIFSMETHLITKELMKPLFDLWFCQMIEKSTLKGFCSYTLCYFIKLPNATVLDAFSTQETVKNTKDSSHIVIGKVIDTLDCDKVQEILLNLASEKETNWNNYLSVINSFMKVHSQASAVISQLIDQLLKVSFENLISTSLQKAVLIGRQMALFSHSSFPFAFKQWFQAQFSDCIPLKNPQTFSFFINELSCLIPYENNVEMIKVALECVLRVSTECQQEYADYIALLKTRVKDLEPQIQPEEIINKVLLTFQENGKIPSYVLEASLMQKHYFLNEFLPVLLVPRVLPQIPDVREKFILELDRAGKIPGSILQKYRTACLEEKQKLIASTS